MLIITEKSAESRFPYMADTSPFQKKHDQKELYSTTGAVVEVVALLKDCLNKPVNGVLDVCKGFSTIASCVIGQ